MLQALLNSRNPSELLSSRGSSKQIVAHKSSALWDLSSAESSQRSQGVGTEGGWGHCLNAKCEICGQISPCGWLFALDVLSRVGAACCLLLWGVTTHCLILGEYFIDVKCYLDAYPDFLVGTTAVFVFCDPWKSALSFL